jgi:hypothetical protein
VPSISPGVGTSNEVAHIAISSSEIGPSFRVTVDLVYLTKDNSKVRQVCWSAGPYPHLSHATAGYPAVVGKHLSRGTLCERRRHALCRCRNGTVPEVVRAAAGTPAGRLGIG